MNHHKKEKMGSKAMLARLALVLLVFLTFGSSVSADPNAPTETNKEKPQHHKHEHKGKENKRGPVERKGPQTQLQHEIQPPKPKKPKEGEDVFDQANPIYLPMIAMTHDNADIVTTEATVPIELENELEETESSEISTETTDAGITSRAVQATKVVDMKLLVIGADGNETDYPAIRAFLDQIGIPYTVLLSANTTLTASMLSDGADHGYYQGVVLVTGNLSYYNSSSGQWESGFTQAEWDLLWQYEAAFGVRQVTSYTYPGGWPDNYGLQYVTYQDTTAAPLNTTLTVAGQQVYSYLKTSSPLPIKNAWVYLATVINTAVTTPLLTSGSYAIASINNYPDGRKNLAITAANNAYLLHSLLLSYGTINWVTKGLFLGERHSYLDPQVDDLLIDSDMWDTTAMTDTTGLLFRVNAADMNAVVNWQNSMRATYPEASTLTLEMAYNGIGSVAGEYTPDDLTPWVITNEDQFKWVSHTYTHANLDAITTAAAQQELTQNHNRGVNFLLLTNPTNPVNYYRDSMVQPDISGLYNANFFLAAKNFGIKYMISDTSRPGWNNPSPNAGFYSTFQPTILIIPRRPTNLFYNLRTPLEWESEYNCFYGPTGTCAGGQFRFWDHNLTYTEILDKESDMWLQYLLKWDIDPLMFHQANLGAYNGTNSLLGDLINATLAKYSQYVNLPIVGIMQHNLGIKMANRMAYNASGIRATWTPCQTITLTTTKAARIPVTGVAYGTAANREVYGGQNISYIQLAANQSLTIPAPACP